MLAPPLHRLRDHELQPESLGPFYEDATTKGASMGCRSLIRCLRDAFQTQVTVIDFTVTQKGLEEQLLGSVIQKEQKSLEEQLNNVLEEVCGSISIQ